MVVRAIIVVLSLIQSLWMLFDGSHALATGTYFGAEQPGPWSRIVSSLGLDPFRMGIPFILLGAAWLVCAVGLVLMQRWGWYGLLVCSVLTLWYVPVGTVLSVAVIVLLVLYRRRWMGR